MEGEEENWLQTPLQASPVGRKAGRSPPNGAEGAWDFSMSLPTTASVNVAHMTTESRNFDISRTPRRGCGVCCCFTHLTEYALSSGQSPSGGQVYGRRRHRQHTGDNTSECSLGG